MKVGAGFRLNRCGARNLQEQIQFNSNNGWLLAFAVVAYPVQMSTLNMKGVNRQVDMGRILYGKYKGIIISVALFLLLDASVLMMNFYISFEIADDAVEVNLAGRQRMLSQRMMKALLDAKVSINDHDALDNALTEIDKTTNLFDTTLSAFDVGGITKGAEGEPVALSAVQSEEGRAAINETKVIWKEYQQRVDALLKIDRDNVDLINGYLALAIGYGKKTNLELLALMNKLTVDLEKVASSKATGLRIIQTVGITLAVINFFIILFHFIRQLREGDEKVESARKETREILDTVNEGLFLLDENLVIGDQHSKELNDIFHNEQISGVSFHQLLEKVVSEKDLDTAKNYVKLLFKPSVKEKLTADLNPLDQIEIHIRKQDGNYQNKFLSFSFKRVYEGKHIAHILVTVRDVTSEVYLSRELEKTRTQNDQQLEMLSSIIHTNREMLTMFIENAYASFNKINLELRAPSKSGNQFLEKLTHIYALIHNFKGEASALKLDRFVQLAHEFEERMEALKQQPDLTGSDFLGLTVMLDKLIGQCQSVQALSEKIANLGQLSVSQPTTDHAIQDKSWDHLQGLASSIADKQDKMVEVLHSGLSDQSYSPELKTLINTISVQFIRNAVTHGIESSLERESCDKPMTGRIDIRVTKRASGALEYSFKDDGAGFNYDAIRSVAVERGLISSQESEVLSRKELVSLIFKEGFSTKESIDEDAGRGIGMYSVMDAVHKVGGKISISSKQGMGCKFIVTLPAVNPVEQAA